MGLRNAGTDGGGCWPAPGRHMDRDSHTWLPGSPHRPRLTLILTTDLHRKPLVCSLCFVEILVPVEPLPPPRLYFCPNLLLIHIIQTLSQEPFSHFTSALPKVAVGDVNTGSESSLMAPKLLNKYLIAFAKDRHGLLCSVSLKQDVKKSCRHVCRRTKIHVVSPHTRVCGGAVGSLTQPKFRSSLAVGQGRTATQGCGYRAEKMRQRHLDENRQKTWSVLRLRWIV